MVATFSETSAITSKKDVVKQNMNNSKSFQSYDLAMIKLWSIFALQ